jgi:putative ABC transport system permease protein
VALFVGSFIILNTFSMLVAQRTRELALLRALGPAARRSRGRSCSRRSSWACLGSAVGLGAGFGIASALRALFGRFGSRSTAAWCSTRPRWGGPSPSVSW